MSTIQWIFLALFFGAFLHEQGKIKSQLLSIEARLRDKLDKPTDWDKWKEEQAKKPFLTKEELDKVMTPEEKEARKKLYGSEYPISK